MIGKVRWCYDYELTARDQRRDFFMLTTGGFPLFMHSGKIELIDDEISLFGDDGTTDSIPPDEITSIFLGYDQLYPARLTKNFGPLWSPLRLPYGHQTQIYLIIAYYVLWTKNKHWFELIKDRLNSENGT